MTKLYKFKNLFFSTLLFHFCLPAFAQEEQNILYRINAGGVESMANVEGEPNWSSDLVGAPSQYSNHEESGNNVEQIEDEVTYHESVPEGTPMAIFKFDRYNGNFESSAQTWTFPVAAGSEVGVRLFFAEVFFEETGERVFHIDINGQRAEEDFDILEEAGGMHIGIMREYQASVSEEGHLTIDLIRVTQNPKINGIEIVRTGTIASILPMANNTLDINLYPNPGTDLITVNSQSVNFNQSSINIIDHKGNRYQAEIIGSDNNNMTLNISSLDKGMYYLMVSDHNTSGGYKFLKD